MKRNIHKWGYFIGAGMACLLLYSFFTKADTEKFMRRHAFRLIPADTLMVNGAPVLMHDFYILETEVTNRQYNEFLHYLKEEGKMKEFLAAQVDSTGWEGVVKDPAMYIKEYHSDDSYADFPVVNISREAANMYCAWLQEQLMYKMPTIQIRLPDVNEWVYAAKGGKADQQYACKENSPYSADSLLNFNFRETGTELKSLEEEDVVAPVYSFDPNFFGLFNMCGNVAEMIGGARPSTKGGSFNSDAEYIKIDGEDEYAGVRKASPYIGFRPVAIIY